MAEEVPPENPIIDKPADPEIKPAADNSRPRENGRFVKKEKIEPSPLPLGQTDITDKPVKFTFATWALIGASVALPGGILLVGAYALWKNRKVVARD
ncbi:MAG TPA: hypothetical protein VFE58_09040 [Tepidisphaeraceae bacterium]|jgi:hypothetical protein|nr:hypothetical protein [Tepidisphaeraceae bacterium]